MAKHFIYIGPVIQVFAAKKDRVEEYLKTQSLNESFEIFDSTSKYVPVVPSSRTHWGESWNVKARSGHQYEIEDTELQEQQFEDEFAFIIEGFEERFGLQNIAIQYCLLTEIRD